MVTVTVKHLRRGDKLAAIAGQSTRGETVAAVEHDGGTLVTLTTRRGPQRRRTVRLVPVATPVTTDPPLPAWRVLDTRREPAGAWKANAAAFAAGAALGVIGHRPAADTSPILGVGN